MNITSNKHFALHTLNAKKVDKITFSEALLQVKDEASLKEQFKQVLEQKGRLYGIYQNKELIGYYLFRYEENYFSEDNYYIQVGEKKQKMSKSLVGDMTSVFKMIDQYVITDNLEEEDIAKYKKEIKEDLSSHIETWGTVAGAEFDGVLLYKNGASEGTGSYYAIGYLFGILLGGLFGMFIFDNFALGLCFGLCFASTYGLMAKNYATKKKGESADAVLEAYLEETTEAVLGGEQDEDEEDDPILEKKLEDIR